MVHAEFAGDRRHALGGVLDAPPRLGQEFRRVERPAGFGAAWRIATTPFVPAQAGTQGRNTPASAVVALDSRELAGGECAGPVRE